MSIRRKPLLVVLALAALSTTVHAGSPCVPEWATPDFVKPAANERVFALAVFDDGIGPALYAGGAFTAIDGVTAAHVAKWDGIAWTTIGDVDGLVRSLTVWDDGSGPALYVGGSFTEVAGIEARRIARWDGVAWSEPGGGTNGGVHALEVLDDGSGPALFAGGFFTTAGGIPAANVAKWDGAAWSPIAEGLDDTVRTLAVYDFGSGPHLYAGGEFARGIAVFDGTSWRRVVDVADRAVLALAVFEGKLYAGGNFSNIGGHAIAYFAAYDGDDWSLVGPAPVFGPVVSLEPFEGDLVLGGFFNSAGGAVVSNVARWDGDGFAAIGSGSNDIVAALAVGDLGDGARLFSGGLLKTNDEFGSFYVLEWDGSVWSPLGNGDGLDDRIEVLETLDAGDGPRLYAGGRFQTAGDARAANVARWNGQRWEAVGAGFDGEVYALAAFDAGSGPVLYAGGYFFNSGPTPARFFARFVGGSWVEVPGAPDGEVYALSVFDDGSGPKLFVGGAFGHAGGVDRRSVARFDGTSWSNAGAGFLGGGVLALAIHDDGSGAKLHAGGTFTSSGGVSTPHVARLRNGAWESVGAGLNKPVLTLVSGDIGFGPALFAGGPFDHSGATLTNHVAQWAGNTWSGMGAGFNRRVRALSVYDDGSGGGPALYAGGDFSFAGPTRVSCIARWDLYEWLPLGAGTNERVSALAIFDDGGARPGLYAGGIFRLAGGGRADRIARWGCR